MGWGDPAPPRSTVLLVTALLALAQTASARPAKKRPTPAPEVKAAEPAPPPAKAPPAKSPDPASPTVAADVASTEEPGPRLSLGVGARLGFLVPMQGTNPVAAFRLRGEIQFVAWPLSPRVSVALLAAPGLSIGGRGDSVSQAGFTVNVSQLAFTLDLLPTAVVEVAFTETLGAYGQLGLGAMLVQYETRAASGFGSIGLTSTNGCGELRLGLGVVYRLTENIRLQADLASIDVLFWEHGVGSLYSFMVGGTYAL